MQEITLEKLQDAYIVAETNYDIEGRAACMNAAFHKVLAEPSLEQTEAGQFFYAKIKIFFLAALDFLRRGEGKEALYYFSQIDEEILGGPAYFPTYAYYMAWAYDLAGNAGKSKCYLLKHLQSFPQNVMAQRNIRLLENGALCLWQERGNLDIAEKCFWEIPIFINSRDRLGCLQELLLWLIEAGYRYIIILDNASTYPPLLAYYEEIQKLGINVVRLPNMGHRALWDSGILEELHVDGPYVYTDSDVVPGKDCPKDFLKKFLEILGKYPYLEKVGNGLFYKDITFFDKEAMKEKESYFYEIPLENDVYFADIDTTMALYRGARHYLRGPAARVMGNYGARHFPWYYDYDNLPADEKYYIKYANQSSSIKMINLKMR